ncbi:MAG: T9SS type A sorting domain-containing protein [Bacteroidales bacterium]|nr:T9SS type A sorting domain-containing protein [Bacteroidales bacterium]
MKRIPGFLVLLLISIVTWGQTSWRMGEMEAKVYLYSPEDGALLKSLKLMDEPAMENGVAMAWVYVTPAEMEKLQASGLEIVVTNPDLNSHSQGFWDQSILESYHNYNQMVELSDSLATNFPAICKKIILGTSPEGRQFGILKISDNVNVNENEPELMFDGGIHGNEIMGPELVIRYARHLCLSYGTDSVLTDLINNREIWLYYVVNPDGFANGIRYNSNGVDCNRDVGFMWGGEGYSPFPFSQPETKILRSLWLEHNFVLYNNFHGGTEVISLPWSYRVSQPPDWVHIQQLASVYSNTSGYPNLGYGQGCIIMYQIFGATKDFNYGALGQIGWSMEISMLKEPPSSQILMYYNYNVPAITEMINRVGRGLNGVVTDSVTGSPVKASIFVNSFYPVYTDAQLGDYHKYVMSGTYSITVKASGYQTKTIEGIVVPPQGAATTNIQLAPAPGRFAYRTIVTEIPYFPSSGNYSDESYVPGIIGPPDSINYSLGRSGYIIIDMGDTIFDGTGDDFKVIEGDTSPEGYYCYVSQTMDGPWTNLGSATGTTAFDLSTGPISGIRYIKITDDGDGITNTNDAGFDLDAIEILTLPLVVDFYPGNSHPCVGDGVNFFDASTGNPTSWLWEFPGGNPSSSTDENPTDITYATAGNYPVTLTVANVFTQQTVTKEDVVQVANSIVVDLGSDTLVCSWESVTLDAGNPGCLYEWSNGASTQTITVDSATFGLGEHTIWVFVTSNGNCQDTDTIHVTIDACTSVGEPVSAPSATIYPNPNSGTFYLTLTNVEKGTCEILTIQGKVVYTSMIERGSATRKITLSHMSEGVYLLRLRSDNQSVIEKLIIQ